MTEFQDRTESLCPHCLRRIPARRITENESVYLEKRCPEHGDLGRTLLWKNNPITYREWNRPGGTAVERKSAAEAFDGCPYDCGICANHRQETCAAILEVSRDCNLSCPVCFAGSCSASSPDPDLNRISRMLEMLLENAGSCPIQLSGGEPTLRDDLPQIVALARKMGFGHVQVNTNGIRLGQDPDYASALKDAGVTNFFLQFDGTTDEIHRRIRGANLMDHKIRAIERCAQLKVGVVLVPTIVKNVNDHQIGAIIQFAKNWIPTIKAVHFQPITFMGRYPFAPCNEDRVLIPDILSAIEKQTGGELRAENLIPSG